MTDNLRKAVEQKNAERLAQPVTGLTAYTRHEAAAVLRVSLPTIDRMVRDGRLGSSKLGSKLLISGIDVVALLPRPKSEAMAENSA